MQSAGASISEIINDLLHLARKHGIRLPSDFALLVKALLLIEGIGRELDDTFNILEIAEPFARELLRKRYRPEEALKRVLHDGKDYGEMLLLLPNKLDTALDLINHDKLQINFRHRGLEQLIIRLDIASNRLSALIVGLSHSLLMVQLRKAGSASADWGGGSLSRLFGVWLIISCPLRAALVLPNSHISGLRKLARGEIWAEENILIRE